MKRLFMTAFAALATLTLAACGGGGGANPAKLRIVHASPDAPNVDAYYEGSKILTDAPYRAATAFMDVEPGLRTLTINPTGSSTSVISTTQNFASDRYYTVLAVNDVANIEPLIVEDNGAAPNPGQAKVRVVHAAPQAPTVDIYVTAPGADLSTASPTLAKVPFKAVSGVLQIPASDYQIRVTPTGTKDPAYDSGSVPVAAGQDLVFVAVEQSMGLAPISLLVLTADPANPVLEIDDQRAQVRVMHASPDAPAVDVLVNDQVALANVPFPVASDYLTVNAGTYNVKVNAAGTGATVIDAELMLRGSMAYTAIATGFLADIQPLVLEDDPTPPAAGQSRLRVVHASPDAPNVDVYANGTRVLSDVAFRAASGYLAVPAGTYQVQVRVANSNVTVLDAPVALDAGKIYTAVAVGSAAPGATNPLALRVLTDR